MSVETHRVTIDAINYGVTLIKMRSRGEGPHQCEVGSATGFFFQDHDRKYLITNKHVVVDERESFFPDNILIRVHSSQESNTVNRDISIPLYGSDHRQLWSEHQDREIDVVAIQIDDYIQTGDVIYYFTSESLPPPNIILGVQENCMIVGYPMGFYDAVHNLPITRVGTIASPYGAFFNGRRHFLIDATLHHGTSGSPVILPSMSVRRTLEATDLTVNIGAFPLHLLGINSGEYRGLGLNAVWYANLIQEIIPPPASSQTQPQQSS